MIPGILGKKIGMTQIFTEDGTRIPVTVIEAGPCQVQAVKTEEKHGYNSVQLGYEDTKERRLNKPQREGLKKTGTLSPKKLVREMRCQEKPDVEVGASVTSRIIQVGDHLDISGTSKGKGFQGGMKRHNWSGGKSTHGSKSHRAPGSIGSSASPSKVLKGLNMPGQMGNERVTVQNLEVVDINVEDNTIAVMGAVPGANGSYLTLRYARKRPLAERIYKEEEEKTGETAEENKDQDTEKTGENKEGNKENNE
ncbi:MAG: 50S ribosomal protein L3 [Candidatus Omnitrophica bacterium]|nr:50S ribosomal protein L3 [Candidatus Omnitrophota bacterium]